MIWVCCPKDVDYDLVYAFDGPVDEWRTVPDARFSSVKTAFEKFGYRAPAGEPRQWCIDNKIKRVPLIGGSWKPTLWYERAVSFRIVPQDETKAVLTKLRWYQGR